MTRSRSGKPTAKRAFGQNFLIDDSYIDRIVRSLMLSPGDTVLEIGAGRGALTEGLLKTGSRVIAIEIDRDLHPVLRVRFHGDDSFHLIADDILQVDISEIFDRMAISAPSKIVGNLPYNISTAILQRFIDHRALFSVGVFMFQREVVDRVTAKPGNSDRGFLTVMAEASLHSEHLFDVPPEAFSPRPKVWSSVAAFRPKPPSIGDEPKFRKLVSAAFAQKRKNLINNLRGFHPDAEACLIAAGIDPRRRAETLDLAEWTRLANNLI